MKNTSLKGISETLLISLNARCNESVNPKGLIHDEKSIEIADKLGSDFRHSKSVHLTNVGTAIRTRVFDFYTHDFLARYPKGTIVNMACGLDTRYYRLDNGQLRWFDLDLPEVIAIRRQFFKENDRFKYIEKSALDFTWLDDIPKDQPILITAEGFFCYLSEDEVKNLLTQVAKAFPKVEFVIEAMSHWIAKNSKKHPSLKGYDAQFKWGIETGKTIDDWNTGFKFVDEYFFMSMKETKRRSWLVKILCLFSSKFRKGMKIFRIRNF